MRAMLAIAAAAGLLAMAAALPDDRLGTYLERSGPHVGAGHPGLDGADGSGVRVAVIDTGVDYNHPDLSGWGPGGKVVGGYNFVDEGAPPLDTNGHGTQVAGVIAADGGASGVAPGAEILAYKVSEDGEGVSSDLIVRAVAAAVKDGADIINISLGVNRTNAAIEEAVARAVSAGVLVVAAAGNDGPGAGTIGSPGRSHGAITVGATYNNLNSSLVATLAVGQDQYTVIPMADSARPGGQVEGPIVFGGYGRPGEIVDAGGSILVVERGSDTEGERLYFSTKERNAADAGAIALVVYNNEPGIFLGELVHEFSGDGYEPRIPVVSVGREEGLEIASAAGAEGAMHLFYNPDFAAHFSSRGPVSPFYIKPDIMAPGAYINTTHSGAAYNFTSGTSYAAPHVAGAAALLLQRDPGMSVSDLRSVLLTTARPVSDAYGNEFPVHAAGSGRLDIAAAYGAGMVITPPSFVVSVPQGGPAPVELGLRPLDGALGDVEVRVDAPGLDVRHHAGDGSMRLEISGTEHGEHEGRVHIARGGSEYVVPFVAHVTPGSVDAVQDGDGLVFDIGHPDGWSYAKVTVSDGSGWERSVGAVPGATARIDIHANGEYWVDAAIRADGGASGAYDVVQVSSLPDGSVAPPLGTDPRPALAVLGAAALVATAGALLRARLPLSRASRP